MVRWSKCSRYELKAAGGDGRVFVRGVKDFVAKYSRRRSGPPPHHVLIFDEAQRAWDSDRVSSKHKDLEAVSEPAAFVSFAERVPGWCVVIGLIGGGQEIHAGEEGGMKLWVDAVAASNAAWEVTGPAQFRAAFEAQGVTYSATNDLHLAQSVRFHFAAGLSESALRLLSLNGLSLHNWHALPRISRAAVISSASRAV